MDTVVERCAGIDIGKRTLAACVRQSGDGRRRRQEVPTFATTTKGLLALPAWLAEERVTVVGMESTGAYWKPVYYLLARGRIRLLAAQCPAPAQRPGW